jgi:hypothetical protein
MKTLGGLLLLMLVAMPAHAQPYAFQTRPTPLGVEIGPGAFTYNANSLPHCHGWFGTSGALVQDGAGTQRRDTVQRLWRASGNDNSGPLANL